MRLSEHLFWSSQFLLLYIPISTLLWLYEQQGQLWVAWLIGLLGVGLLNCYLILFYSHDDVLYTKPNPVRVISESVSRRGRPPVKATKETIVEVKKHDVPIQPVKKGKVSNDEFSDEMHNDVDLDELDPHADDPFS